MSKRKNQDSYDSLIKRIKDLEKVVESARPKRKRIRVISSDSSDNETSPPCRQVRQPGTRDCRGAGSATSRLQNTDRNSGATEENEDLVSTIYAQHQPSSKDTCHIEVDATILNETRADAPAVAAPSSSAVPLPPCTEDVPLDDDILEILGIDPTKSEVFGPDIQKDVAVRFEHCATTGLTKELRKELTEKHRIPGNCKLIDAPILNPEMKAAMNEALIKRDKAIETKQKLLAAAISSLGAAITQVLALKEKQPDLLRLLIDTGRILCDCQHKDSITRRNYVTSTLKPEMTAQVKDTKIDKHLFGENLLETVKTAKAINKSGADLKATSGVFTKPKVSTKPMTGTSKNWKYSNRKQTIVPKRKDPVATPPPATGTRNPRASSSKTSQRPRTSRR